MKVQSSDSGSRVESDPLMGITQLAQRLGVQVKTIYGWVHMRQIPFVKVGGCLRFCSKDIDAWIQSKKVLMRDID